MTFPEALVHMKRGYFAYRPDWSGLYGEVVGKGRLAHRKYANFPFISFLKIDTVNQIKMIWSPTYEELAASDWEVMDEDIVKQLMRMDK